MNPKIKSIDMITAQNRPMLSRDEHDADMTALEAAWDWLCASRKTAPPNADKDIEGIAPRALENHREKVRRLYERTRHWSKAKQAKRVSDNRKRWKNWVLSPSAAMLGAGLLLASNPGSTATVRPGVGWLEPTDVQAISTTKNVASSGIMTHRHAYGFAGSAGLGWGVSSDGVAQGIVIEEDILVAFEGSYVAEAPGFRDSTITYSYSLAPTLSLGMKTVNMDGYAYQFGPDNGPNWLGAGKLRATGSLSGKIYVGPKAALGTRVVPVVYAGTGIVLTDGTMFTGGRLLGDGSNTLTIASPLTCSVVSPPVIDFGVIYGVGIKENSFIAQDIGNINISCNGGPSSSALVKVQVLANVNLSWILPLTLDNGDLSPGEIRGWINQSPTNTCSGNADVTNGLRFGDSNKWYDGGELKAGSNTIPYVFNLCGSGKNKINNLGHASATATINLSWD